MDFKELLLNVGLALLIPILTTLSGQLILWFSQWLKQRGLDLSAEQQAKLEALAQKAILAVEEWARGQAKSGIKTTGDTKLALAKQILSGQLPTVTPDMIEAAINTQLATLRVAAPETFAAVRVDPT